MLDDLVPHVIKPERIRWIRKILRLTRGEFARKLWVQVETLKQWEKGRRTPNGPALKLLCYYEREAENKTGGLRG